MQNAASGRALAGSRSPKARLPTWSWFWLKTTNCSGARSSARAPKRRPAEGRVAAVVDVRAMEGLGQLRHLAELLVPPRALAGEQRVQGVVEVVGPHGVVAVAALARRADDLGVVEAALGDDQRAAVLRADALGQLAQHVAGPVVVDGVDRVEAQAVDVEVAHPAGRALQHPLADAVGVLAVEVDRLAPRRLVALGEERSEGLERLDAAGADVVVDDVEDDAEARGVGGVDEARQAVRAAVGRVGGGEVDAVVAPAVVAGELGDRHELDVGDAELGQRRQPRPRRPRRCPRR